MEEGGGAGLAAECVDEPPNSRLFVVLGKDAGKALIRERFAPFGDIQNICLVRDRLTSESRGVAYVKFARSSQACRAMEALHGRSLAPDTKPIKVPPGRPAPLAGPGAAVLRGDGRDEQAVATARWLLPVSRMLLSYARGKALVPPGQTGVGIGVGAWRAGAPLLLTSFLSRLVPAGPRGFRHFPADPRQPPLSQVAPWSQGLSTLRLFLCI